MLCTHSFPHEKFQTTTVAQCPDFSHMDTSFAKAKLHLLYLLQRGGTESCQLQHLPLGVFFLTLAESQSCHILTMFLWIIYLEVGFTFLSYKAEAAKLSLLGI